MFIIHIHYTVPLEEVDRHLPAHVEWLHGHEAAGRFVTYGRLVPRTGAIIVADVPTREELDAILAADPFQINGVGTVEVMQFSENKGFRARKNP
ncbi:MAG: YciI family protein [Opitutales bacterium]|jgi:uncharacterized protein YciI